MTLFGPKFRRSLSSTVRTPCNRLLNLIDPPVVVLLYHRVADLGFDPELLAVSPENFRAQMRYLQETVPLVRFEADWGGRSKPALAVTFDDGYADNWLQALPILEDTGVPATFFVSTGPIAGGTQFWWHQLEQIILGEEPSPAGIALDGCGRRGRWPTGNPEERLICYRELAVLMKDADCRQRADWLAQLCRQTARAPSADRHRALTVDELRLLAGSELVTIGAHTVSHSRLAMLSAEAQQEEITASKKQLESWLDREVATFSYPYGKRSDYNRQSVALCRQAGFRKVAANFPGQAHRWSDPFQIPRLLVRNWTAQDFARKLQEFWTR